MKYPTCHIPCAYAYMLVVLLCVCNGIMGGMAAHGGGIMADEVIEVIQHGGLCTMNDSHTRFLMFIDEL